MRDTRKHSLAQRLAKSEQGQALVEMALMTPILLILIAGIVEAGRAFVIYVQLENASREGARAGVLVPKLTSDIQAATRRELPTEIANAVNVVVTCSSGITSTFLDCVTSFPPNSGDKIAVSVSYNYEPIMPIVNGITTLTNLTMHANTVMQVQ